MIENPLTKSLARLLQDSLIDPTGGSTQTISLDLAHHAGKRHRIAPVLYSLVKAGSLSAGASSLEFLQDSYRYAGLHAVQQARVRSMVQDALSDAKVQFSELKGRGLARQLYPDPAARFSKDIDILVRKGDGTGAWQALVDAGFIAKSKKKGRINKFAKHEMWALKDTSLADPQFGQQVELHSRLFQSEPADMSDAFMDATGWEKVPQISNPFYAFYLIMHGAHCHWASLKWLLDFALLVRQPDASPKEVFDLAKSFHSLSAVSASVEFAHSVFPDCIPDEWLKQARQFETAKSAKLRVSFGEILCYSPPRVKHAGYPFTDWYIYDGGLDYWQAIPRRLVTPFFRFL